MSSWFSFGSEEPQEEAIQEMQGGADDYVQGVIHQEYTAKKREVCQEVMSINRVSTSEDKADMLTCLRKFDQAHMLSMIALGAMGQQE